MDSEKKVITAAIYWWKFKRPLSFSEQDHLLNPTINCTTVTEKRLAKSVKELINYKKFCR